MQPAAAIPIATALPDEEQARAGLYALLARLWAAAPDAALLAALARQADAAADPDAAGHRTDAAGGPMGDAPGARRAALDDAWCALCAAAGSTEPGQAADEYAAAFVGIGRPEVFLHGSYYQAGFLHERPLARLRGELAALGLARRADRAETEDHVAMLCETMRYLIRSDDPGLASMTVQRRFFHAHLVGWSDALADAVLASAATNFYRHVARLTRAFIDVERAAFDLE